ncbi:sphingomyelin phosphodiesterase [Streptomyces sp. NPDC055109]
MTHNLMLLPSGITDWEPDRRAMIASEADYLKVPDVVVLTELFDNSASDLLLRKIRSHHPFSTPVIGRSELGWDRTSGGYFGAPLEDGGVAILSKWPISHREQYIYGGGCGADFWAAKGFAYAVIEEMGQKFHFIGTHLQANDSGCEVGEAQGERLKQVKSLSRFLQNANISTAEPIIISGDFNIAEDSAEYRRLISLLNVSPPVFPAGSASYSPGSNSIARYRDPTGHPSLLDFVFWRNGHPRPVFGWGNSVLTEKSKSFLMRNQVFVDYSDHYPVMSSRMR